MKAFDKMKVFKTIFISAFASLLSLSAFAYRYVGSNAEMGKEDIAEQKSVGSRAAQCAPAVGLRDLEWNNVRTRIETGGSMWQDRANGRAAYEVPKDEGVSSIYAGGLWMGGLSTDQTLRLAAIRFRQGNDYWPGPLTTDGTAEVDAATCVQYDNFAVTLRQDAQTHRLYHDMINAGATPEEMEAVGLGTYSTPGYFYSYPAHGNTALLQDYYLAPFYDYDGDEAYNPANGDYPWYDFLREIDCANRKREDQVPLYGDQNFYWIFNDKGNVHTESTGAAIGMEVRAQAFAFTSNDEVNNMTFLNYVLINQGTQRLTQTYFGSYVDPDLGFPYDDYVGCDVQRGLGYCYNGDGFDESGTSSLGYGNYLPAVGVDFFEGPYQDADGIDNPLTSDIAVAEAMKGIPYKGLGIGYGDSIVDNERFGMRRFVYYNNSSAMNGDPFQPMHYYNYMRGIWKNNQPMLFGGDGFNQGVVQGLEAQYMFPGDSDPYNWGTHGVVPPAGNYPWSEVSTGNPPNDRRFVQSAGPFTLEPGDYNNITLGVVWARGTSKNNNWEPVELLRLADDKAQSLFDNCFELVSGPDAPDVTVRELDREIILMLSNENSLSNNYHEEYLELDPSIPDSLNGVFLTDAQRSYQFEGYLVYQLSTAAVSNADLDDPDKARLIAQCDVRNGVTNMINYDRDGTTGIIVPELMVQGTDNGIIRSFRITTDAFATSANSLINHRTYYFMVIAYGYNEYAPYNVADNTGQSQVFKSSRKSATGEVKVIKAIPHNTTPANGGTVLNSTYGDGFMLTRIEGKGNGTQVLSITGEHENAILSAPYSLNELDYLPGGAPVLVKVVDPLRIPAADFELRLNDDSGIGNIDSLYWSLTNLTDGSPSYNSYTSFRTPSEDVVLDYGISILWGQYTYLNPAGGLEPHKTAFLSGTIEFSNNREPWLTGVPDTDAMGAQNWIRSGTFAPAQNNQEEKLYADYQWANGSWIDGEGDYEKILSGTVAPYCLVSFTDNGSFANPIAPTFGQTPIESAANTNSPFLVGDMSSQASRISALATNFKFISGIAGLNNVDIVITPDKSKWTRSPVLEMQPLEQLAQNALNPSQGAPSKMKLRKHLSVDKNGLVEGQAGYNAAEGGLTGATGMGWFPGYAIDVGTGERLNIAFGEDSWLSGDNGRDMLWNPSSNYYTATGQAVFGGQHWVYVFKNLRNEINVSPTEEFHCPRYDEGKFLYSKLRNGSSDQMKEAFAACTWVCSAIMQEGYSYKTPQEGLVPGKVKLRLRVAKPYAKYAPTAQPTSNLNGAQNAWRNLYKFSTKGSAASLQVADVKKDALDMINIVPNPYYAFSGYETGKLDNRVKIVNLPEECVISIYDLKGTLIRQFKKGDPLTSLDWDLKNHINVPIASGTYIIHVNVPGVGEKVLKWFGVMRPVDLDNF